MLTLDQRFAQVAALRDCAFTYRESALKVETVNKGLASPS
jgi:hypothetical protein